MKIRKITDDIPHVINYLVTDVDEFLFQQGTFNVKLAFYNVCIQISPYALIKIIQKARAYGIIDFTGKVAFTNASRKKMLDD